ncbi:glycosyltransferase family 2 protein [Corynebacterium resistens]|nr:glycosyltransferase family 2 protein [Corynebacterium resistens]
MAPIAIITVTFSPGEYLGKFLASTPTAASQGTHVVMVDNGSTDGAPEAAEAQGLAELVYSGGNVGYGAGMNFGARWLREARANGTVDDEFFVIANPDVVFQPSAIDKMLEVARENPRAGAVGPRIDEPDGGIYPSARRVPELGSGIGHALLGPIWPGNPWTKRYLADADMTHEKVTGWLSGSCLLMRWSAFESIGGFDERYFMYMEDVDLGDRLGKAGWLNIYTPEARITHAKGHSAGKHPDIVLPAHHKSAYRFLADRNPGAVKAPLRVALKLGLALRGRLALAIALARREPV